MNTPAPARSRFSLGWLAGWSWAERGIVVAACLLPIAVLIVAGRAANWLAGVLTFVAVVLVNLVVWRHGGWRLFGPHFYYDVIRLARRGRSTLLRVVYVSVLFGGLFVVFQNTHFAGNLRPNDFARVSEQFSFALFMVQNVAVMILTPAYVASAIAEEKERRTMEMLFTTQLSDTEIVLGIFFARIIHLVGFVIAGLPILTVVQFWGGIDMLLLAGNIANTILNILTVGSICLFVSTMSKTVNISVMGSYAVIVPIASCYLCALRGSPFVLQDARTGARFFTVQDLGWIAVGHAIITTIALTLAARTLRAADSLFAPGASEPRPRSRGVGGPSAQSRAGGPSVSREPPRRPPPPPTMAKEPERLDAMAVPYTLPPIPDNALLWKERFLGGPALAFSPVVLVPLVPFFVTGVALMTVWFFRALSLDAHDFRQALEVWYGILRFFYYVFLAFYVLGVAFRAAATVARERQQQTLEPLLLLPIERRDILRAKLIGCLWRGWPWFALVLVDAALGTLLGAYHPVSAVLLCLAPIPLVLAVATLGMFLSIISATVLRANLTMVIVLIALVSLTFCCPREIGPLTYLEAFAFNWWIRRETMPVDLASAIAFGYLIVSSVCWIAACLQFESRARQS